MISLIKFVISGVLLLFLVAYVSAQNNSKELTLADVAKTFLSDDDEDEGRRRKKRFQYGHHLWWWGLKALSVLVTVKIKVILLFLFLAGGIFYGLKVWQGTAIGCPEPIIKEVQHHEGILPYHSHFSSPDISYSAPPPDAYSSYSGYSGYSDSSYSGGDLSGIYSNTPSYSSPPPSPAYAPTAGAAASAGTIDTGPSNAYLPPSSRRRIVSRTARSASDSDSSLFTNLLFRFLGVNTDTCKRRFVCELEFRNPFVGYAMNYIGNDLFKEYRLPKESPKTPKKFSDCAKLYAECEIPKEHTFASVPKKRRRYFLKNRLNQTTVAEEEKEETTIVPINETSYV